MIVAAKDAKDIEKILQCKELRTHCLILDNNKRVFELCPEAMTPHELESACLSLIISNSAIVEHSKSKWLAWCTKLSHDCQTHEMYASSSINHNHHDNIPNPQTLTPRQSTVNDNGNDNDNEVMSLLSSTASTCSSTHPSSDGSLAYFQQGFSAWLMKSSPETLISFCEIEVELITGKTYQCRGQLQAVSSHVHIAGDNLYSGICSSSGIFIAKTMNGHIDIDIKKECNDNLECEIPDSNTTRRMRFLSSPYLALQAYQLSFHIDDETRYRWRKKRFARQNSVSSRENTKADHVHITLPHPWWYPLSRYLKIPIDNCKQENEK